MYLYENQAGEQREVVGTMADPPPEFIMIFEDLEWLPVDAIIEGKERVEELIRTPQENRIWQRVYGAGLGISVPNFAVNTPKNGGLPISRSSPRRSGGVPRKVGKHMVKEHKDGTVTNMQGQPIIDSNAAAKRNADTTGMELD